MTKNKSLKLGVRKLTKKEIKEFGIRECHYCDDGTTPVLDEWTQMVAGEECYLLACVRCGLFQFFCYHH